MVSSVDLQFVIVIFPHHAQILFGLKERESRLFLLYEPRPEVSNNVVYATSRASDQLVHTRSLIRVFASRLNILCVLSSCLNAILEFLSLKGGYTGWPESTHVKLPHC